MKLRLQCLVKANSSLTYVGFQKAGGIPPFNIFLVSEDLTQPHEEGPWIQVAVGGFPIT